MTQSNQDDITEKEISQDPKDYISIYRLLMYVKATNFSDGLSYFSNDEKEVISPSFEYIPTNDIPHKRAREIKINKSLYVELYFLPFIFDEIMPILERNNINVYLKTNGINQKIIFNSKLIDEMNQLLSFFRKYRNYSIEHYTEEDQHPFYELFYKNLNNPQWSLFNGKNKDVEKKLYDLLMFIDVKLDELSELMITREIAETVFNYPKEYRPDGYNEQKDIEAQNHQLKAELEAKEKELQKVVADLEKAKKELNSRKHNNSTIETKDQVIEGLCYMVQRETNLKETWKHLNIQKGKITKTSLSKVLNEILECKLNIPTLTRREQETIIKNLIDTKDRD